LICDAKWHVLGRLVETCETTLSGRRDRALPLIGSAGALRRSELIAITREDVVFPADGLRLTVPRAKADQTGKGASLGIPRVTAPIPAVGPPGDAPWRVVTSGRPGATSVAETDQTHAEQGEGGRFRSRNRCRRKWQWQ
jgi:hypothetical protein